MFDVDLSFYQKIIDNIRIIFYRDDDWRGRYIIHDIRPTCTLEYKKGYASILYNNISNGERFIEIYL